jgi:hypothetical protein
MKKLLTVGMLILFPSASIAAEVTALMALREQSKAMEKSSASHWEPTRSKMRRT